MTQELVENSGNLKSFIIFQIGWEQFAIDFLDVKEIIQAGQIRKLPKSLDFVDGIYNYRGEIIHIINLKKKLKLDNYLLYKSRLNSIDDDGNGSNSKHIIILNIRNTHIGFLIDRIINIADVNDKNIIALSPIFQTSVGVEYVKGIVKLEDKPRIVINLRKIAGEVEENAISKEISSKT